MPHEPLSATGDLLKFADEEVLRRFVASRKEAAFAFLVRRHGPAALIVRCRVLGDAVVKPIGTRESR